MASSVLSCLKLPRSTTTEPTLQFTGSSLTTSAVSGAQEYDGTFHYLTSNTQSGRGFLPTVQVFNDVGDPIGVGPAIADFFSAGSSISLPGSARYKIEYFIRFTKNTAGTVTFSFLASSAVQRINAEYVMSPVTGEGTAGAPITGYTGSGASTTATFAATGSLTTTVNHYAHITVYVATNPVSCNFRLRVTSSAGTVARQADSFYTVTRISSTTGSFAT